MHNAHPVVRMAGITKRFGALSANHEIDFNLYPGEIHALLGENGAGKSTLMNVLAGVFSPDSGTIEVFGKPIRFRSPREAIRAGVGMVYQHFAQAPMCTVCQNVVLADPDAPFWLDYDSLEQKVSDLISQYSLQLQPKARVYDLSVGERQRLELLRLLSKDAEVLILDEPTAVLTPGETEELFVTLKALAAKGKSIVFITHKLHEVETCAHRITVLRKGRVAAANLNVKECNAAMLAELMVGKTVTLAKYGDHSAPGRNVLELTKISVLSEEGMQALFEIDLNVRSGEILAVAGVAGNGQKELAEAAFCFKPLLAGQRRILGNDAISWGPIQMRRMGAGFVPEDRVDLGICSTLSVMDNLNLTRYAAAAPFFPSAERMKQRADTLAASTEVMAQDMNMPVRMLSGGNIQRLILARELNDASRLLIVSQPTRGLDIEASAAVHQILIAKRDSGVGILLISYDLDEILLLADRIIVMMRGRIAAWFERPFPDKAAIGIAMAGGN